MNPAYRIPKGKFPVVDRFVSQETEVNTPITEMVVNSLVTNLEEGQKFAFGQEITVAGVAWDGGYGIATVEVSEDGGRNWRAAQLAADPGRFSWRQWSHRLTPGACRQPYLHGKGDQSRRSYADFRSDLQPRRLPQQRGAADQLRDHVGVADAHDTRAVADCALRRRWRRRASYGSGMGLADNWWKPTASCATASITFR